MNLEDICICGLWKYTSCAQHNKSFELGIVARGEEE